MRESKAGTVLIVEAEPQLRELVAFVLREEGYQVIAVGAGRRALQMLRSGDLPAVVLLGSDLDDMPGQQLRAEMLRDGALAGVPVIALSALPGSLSTGPELQVFECLGKPDCLGRLLQLLRPYSERPFEGAMPWLRPAVTLPAVA